MTLSTEDVHNMLCWRTFTTNVHLLANRLRLSDADAQQLLLVNLLEHRFKNVENLSTAIKQHNRNLGWRITYQRLDIQTKHYKELGKIANREYHSESLEQDIETGVITVKLDNRPVKISEFKIQQLLTLFRTIQTQHFVEMLLRFGKLETMASMNLSPIQFERRLRYTISYVIQHKTAFSLLVDSERDKRIDEVNALNWLDEELTKTSPDIQSWIDHNLTLATDLVNDPLIQLQGLLITSYQVADCRDQYCFINNGYERRAINQAWLAKSNAQIEQVKVAQ